MLWYYNVNNNQTTDTQTDIEQNKNYCPSVFKQVDSN